MQSVRKLALQSQHPYLSGGDGSIQVYRRGNKSELTFGNSGVAPRENCDDPFESVRAKRLRCGYDRPVKNFVRGIVIAQGQITSSKIGQDWCVLWIELSGMFKVRNRFFPFALTALNGPDGEVGIGLIRKSMFRDFKMFERSRVIAIAIIIRKAQSKLALRKIRIQLQSFFGRDAGFFPARRCWIEAVIRPAVDLRELGKCCGKIWIKLDRLFVKALRIQGGVAEMVGRVRNIVRLHEQEVGV
ncbi:MAG: hypothetical protein Udaeo2_32510 [Candidatus Udaeobacter sp.]|nr:MAG: hypothetical protein Udaeo2_32510 [Candidatus Udaeobacter sp.]